MFLVPIFIVILTAVKGKAEFYGSSVFSLPSEIKWSNFSEAWVKGKLGLYMKNGLIITVLKVPIGIFLSSLIAFALTRMNMKHATKWFIFFLVGMMIPHQVLLIPLNIFMTRIGLVNSYLGLFIVYTACGLPLGILVMRGFFRTIPYEIDESAHIDGCKYFRLFWSISLPIAKPALSTLVIINFLNTWNEYLLASILITHPTMRTVPVGLMRFVDESGYEYGYLSAAVLMSIIPVLLIYLLFQRYFVEGLSGSVKG